MSTTTGRPKGVPLKGQKNINGEWAFPNAQYEDHEVTVFDLGLGMNPVYGRLAETVPAGVPAETTTTAQPSVTMTHHDMIHPRKGMSAYERRNWLNARAGWPVKG
jgi:hypothetical protein